MQNAPKEHSAMLSTFIKLPFVIKTFFLSIFERSLKMGFIEFFFDRVPEAVYGDNQDMLGEVFVDTVDTVSYFSIKSATYNLQ